MSSVLERIAAAKAAASKNRGGEALANSHAIAPQAVTTAAQPIAQSAINPALAALLASAKAKAGIGIAPTATNADVAAIVQATQQPVAAQAKPAFKPPIGTEDFEANHPDLCEATRKLASELHEEQDGIRFWLDRVHEQLRMNPELLHMLTDEQASALYRGIIYRSQVTIVPEKAKASKPKAAAKVQGKLEDM